MSSTTAFNQASRLGLPFAPMAGKRRFGMLAISARTVSQSRFLGRQRQIEIQFLVDIDLHSADGLESRTTSTP